MNYMKNGWIIASDAAEDSSLNNKWPQCPTKGQDGCEGREEERKRGREEERKR